MTGLLATEANLCSVKCHRHQQITAMKCLLDMFYVFQQSQVRNDFTALVCYNSFQLFMCSYFLYGR